MKSKSMLFLMELVLVILFFSIAAAICLKIFAGAETLTSDAKNTAKATAVVQSCAEVFKSVNGDAQTAAEILGGTAKNGGFELYYNNDWCMCIDNPTFVVALNCTETKTYIINAHITASENGTEFYAVDTAVLL